MQSLYTHHYTNVVNNAIQFNAEYKTTHMANSSTINTLSTCAFFIYTAQMFTALLPLFPLYSIPAFYDIIE